MTRRRGFLVALIATAAGVAIVAIASGSLRGDKYQGADLAAALERSYTESGRGPAALVCEARASDTEWECQGTLSSKATGTFSAEITAGGGLRPRRLR